MSVLFFAGLPGAGKSYAAVQLIILPALAVGRPVRTNIPLKLDEIRAVYPGSDVSVFSTQEMLAAVKAGKDWWADECPGGSVVVVDELSLIWPSGQKGNAVEASHREFIAMHRHRVGKVRGEDLATEVVLLSQDTNDVASWVKGKVDKTYILDKLDHVGAEKMYRLDVYQKIVDTRRPLKRSHIRGMTGRYDSKVFDYYHSHTQAEGDVVNAKECRLDKKNTVFHSFGFRASAVVFVLVLLFVGWFGPRAFRRVILGDRPEAVVDRPAPVVRGAVTAPPVLRHVAPPVVPVSQVWRVTGVMRSGIRAVVIAEDDEGRSRRLPLGDCAWHGSQVSCVVDGARITSWSGAAPSSAPSLVAAVSSGLSRPAPFPVSSPQLAEEKTPGTGPARWPRR